MVLLCCTLSDVVKNQMGARCEVLVNRHDELDPAARKKHPTLTPRSS
jgi:hypothetical protein